VSQQINLFNPAFRRQKKYFSAITMIQALILIVLGAGLFYEYASSQVRQLTGLVAETGKRYTTEQTRLAELQARASSQQNSQLLENELKQIQARANSQQVLVDTLKSGVLGNTSGYSEYMRAFARQVVSGLWLTGFDIAGDATQLNMSGGVLSPDLLPAYVQRLSREKVMHGKSFAALQMQQPKPGTAKSAHYVEFTLQSVEGGGDKNGETHGKAP